MRPAAVAAALLLLRAEVAPLPDGNAYVRRLVEKERHREEVLDRYTYDLLAVREDLDDRGRVKQSHARRFETFYVKGRPVRRLVEENGRALEPDEQARADREAREMVEAVRGGRAISERPGVRLSVLLDRYDFRSIGRETIAGRPAIVLDFTPRAGGREKGGDRLLRQVRGRVWVDEADEEVMRAELASLAPVKLGGGLGATVSSLTTRIEFRKVDDTVWLPAEDETLAAGRMMIFKKFRTRFRRTYSAYRRFSVESEEAHPTPAPSASPPPPSPSPPAISPPVSVRPSIPSSLRAPS
jgi:hypothetical protein